MTTLVRPPGRPAFELPRALGLALCVLMASSLAACGRSSLLDLHEDGAAGHGGAGADGGPRTDAARDSNPGDHPTTGDGRPAADGGVDRAPDAPGKIAIALAVAPTLISLPVGATGGFSATVTFADGTMGDVTTSATWTSDAPLVAATISGRVTALRAGTANVTARYGALSASGRVVVMTTISLASIALEPPLATLVIGSSLNVRVIGTYSDGSTADVTAMAKLIDDGSGVVITDAAGDVTGLKAGTATILATVGTLASKMIVIVSPATVVGISVLPPVGTAGVGTTTAFTADATLSDGTHADVTASATWSVADGTVAAVDARGVATGTKTGKTVVTAAFGGQSGQATLVVTGATLVTLEIDPVDPSVGVNVALTFAATGLYSDGTKVDLTSQVMWTSSAPSVLPIDGTGHAFSKSVGTSVVTATTGLLTAASTVTVTAASLDSISVTPALTTLSPGGTVALQAVGTYADGTVVDLTASVTWSSAPPGLVSVSNAAGSAGTATALSPGVSVVTASSGMISGNAKIVVSPATLKAITVSPSSSVLPIGATAKLTAEGSFSDGTSRDVTGEVSWTSGNDSTATVANAPGVPGTVTGVAAGMVGISASEDGVVGMAGVAVVAATLQTIIVSPADATLTAGLRSSYTATGLYSDGSKIDVTAQVTWTTDNTGIATISNVAGASGQALGRAAGTTVVRATLGMIAGTTTLTVTGATASSLSIAPIAVSTPSGTGLQYTATLVFTNGTTRNVTGQAAWSTTNPMAATISRAGRATPVAVGMTTVGATYMGLSATTTLTVTDAVPTSIQLTPIAPTMPVGTSTQFNVTAILSDGTTRNVTAAASFVSSAPGVVGIVTARMMHGRATAVGAGSAVITATYMGFTDMTTVTSTDAVIVQISVSPAGLTLPVGARRQFTAQAIRSDGTSMAITGQATWTSDAPGVAAVSTAGATRGQVTGIGAGAANISATYMGLTGSVPVAVTAATLTTVQVTPFTPTISLNTPLQFVATAIYSDGTNVAVTGMATWLSSNAGVAGVSTAAGSRGRAMSLAKGATTISATYLNVTGSTLLTVTDATITQIQVTPFMPSIPAGFDQQLEATAIYSDGTNRDITSLATWTSTVPATATVSDALATKGLVNGSTGGVVTIVAQYTGVAGQTGVTVSSASLMSLSVAPATPTAAAGATVAFTATGAFDDGSTLDVTRFVTWTSSNLDVADVSNADGSRGQATAFGAGATNIQAQRATLTATATLTVQ
jgi:hypothetical protein